MLATALKGGVLPLRAGEYTLLLRRSKHDAAGAMRDPIALPRAGPLTLALC